MALREASCAKLHLIYHLHLVYLVRKVVSVHLVAVRLTSWTLNLNAMALQDGCFFKNTNAIIAYRPRGTTQLASQSLTEDNHKQPVGSFALQVTHDQWKGSVVPQHV